MSFIPGWFPAGVVGGRKNPSIRFLGAAYTISAAGTSGSFVLPAADMGVPHPFRQFICFVAMSGSTIGSATFGGGAVVVSPHRLDTSQNAWDGWVSGYWPTNTNLTVGITLNGAIGSETFQVAVWEVYDAPPLQSCAIYTGGANAGFSADSVHIPVGAVVIAAAQKGGLSSTWTNITEVVDSSVGSVVGITAAQIATPALTAQDIAISVTNITGAEGSVIVIPPNYLPWVGCQLLDIRGRSGSGTTITITAAELPAEARGNWTLVAAVSYEKDGSPVTAATYGGNAMTLHGNVSHVVGGDNDPNVAILSIDITNNSPIGDLVISVPAGINTFTTFVTCWAVYNKGSFGAFESNTVTAAASITTQVDVNEFGAIVAVVARNVDTVSATWSGANKLNDIDQGANRAGSAHVANLNAQVNRNITVTPASNDNMAMAAIAINR
jgi:hypothetical protein